MQCNPLKQGFLMDSHGFQIRFFRLFHGFFGVISGYGRAGFARASMGVEDGGGQQLGSHETLVERFLVQYLFNQAVGNDLAGLVMLGIHFQYFGFGSPMHLYTDY